jgi:hypothetical protein
MAHFGRALPLTRCVPIARMGRVVTVWALPYPSDLTDEQWDLTEPVFQRSSRGHSLTARHREAECG